MARLSCRAIVMVGLVTNSLSLIVLASEPPSAVSDRSSFSSDDLVLIQTTVPSRQPSDGFAVARRELVDTKIRTAGVTNERVLSAILATPRHEFVPPSVRSLAYQDMALPIGGAQTISSPFIVASMTEQLDPRPSDRVLEIGTGSGYQAAVLSPLVADVYSIEIVEELGERAASVLAKLGYANVHTRIGDGFLGWPEAAPFDKIIVTCSPESIPQPLVDQLREGGVMIIPVGERYQQTLYLMKKLDGELVKEPLQPTLFVPMTGTAEASREQQPDPANPRLVNGDFEEESRESANAEFVDGWYYGRQVKWTVENGHGMVRFENQTPGLGSHLMQGIAIDGTKVTLLRMSARLQMSKVIQGPQKDESPMVVIVFYDDDRREVGFSVLGPYRGTHPWHRVSRLVNVPPTSKEAILRIGLFGATGRIEFDDVKIERVE